MASKPLPVEEEPDIFERLDSMDAMAAYLFDRFGADALRQTLQSTEGLNREFLQDAAEKLSAIGFDRPAKILRAEARQRPSSITDCPYEKGSTNEGAWLAWWQRKHGRACS